MRKNLVMAFVFWVMITPYSDYPERQRLNVYIDFLIYYMDMNGGG